MYFTSTIDKSRDIWQAEEFRDGINKTTQHVQTVIDHPTDETTSSLAWGSISITVGLSITVFIMASIGTGWLYSDQSIPYAPIVAASIAFVLASALTTWAVIDRFKTMSLLKRINASRYNYRYAFVTPTHYSFQQLFCSDEKWFNATNFAYGQAPQFIDQYFRATLEDDITIEKGGQDVEILKQSINKLARQVREACTADAARRMRDNADYLDKVEFKLQPPLYNDVK